MEKLIFTFIISALLISCQNSTTPLNPAVGETFEIKFGESATIQSEQIQVTFEELIEDSRCPEDVVCVWAGNAKIIIQVDDQEVSLNTYSNPKYAELSEYNIKLISLNPYPRQDTVIEKENYSAEILVTKK